MKVHVQRINISTPSRKRRRRNRGKPSIRKAPNPSGLTPHLRVSDGWSPKKINVSKGSDGLTPGTPPPLCLVPLPRLLHFRLASLRQNERNHPTPLRKSPPPI